MDNTLYDWRAHFCSDFEPLVAALSDLTGECTAALKAKFRAIHRGEGHMDSLSLVERLPSIAAWTGGAQERAELQRLATRFRRLSHAALCPYPGVRGTLRAFARNGYDIVVFTESPVSPAAQRLKALRLGGLRRVRKPAGRPYR